MKKPNIWYDYCSSYFITTTSGVIGDVRAAAAANLLYKGNKMKPRTRLTGKTRKQAHHFTLDDLISKGMARLFLNLRSSGEALDKRDKHRKFCHIPSKFISQNQADSVLIKNISKDGAFIETPHSFQIGQKITLTVPFSFFDLPVIVPGKIIRSTPSGYGVRFTVSETVH